MSKNKTYTFADIEQERTALQKEMRKHRQAMNEKARTLFTPPPADTKAEKLMNNINRVVAIYDGVMLGLKLVNRFRGFFRKKKR